jgi:hypothetical protein
MYCSSCGIEVSKELNYCNRCGANLNSPAQPLPQIYSPPVKLTGPTIALGATVVLSIVAIFAGADSLALRGVHPTALAWMIIISLATVFGITGLVVRLWTSLLANSSNRNEGQRPVQLNKPTPHAQLPGPQTGPMNIPVSSVTDHTTRTFDSKYRERVERGQ